MKFMHSYWTKPRSDKYDYSVDLWYAALSITYLHLQNHTIVLYTDTKGKEIFSCLPYDEILVVLDDLHETINPHIWSASKFKAMELADLETIHIDYDFILKDDSIVQFDWYHDMLCQSMIRNNPDYEFVSRMIKKSCPNLELPEGLHHEFNDHILHLGCWAIYNPELKEKIINAYNQLATDLTKQFPDNLWEANRAFIPNLTLEEKLVGELAKPYKNACIIDIWSCNKQVPLQEENDICEHFAGKDKKYRVGHIKQTLKSIDIDLYNKVLLYEDKMKTIVNDEKSISNLHYY